jgi:hypothetical protein
MHGDPPGFAAAHFPYSKAGGIRGDRWELAVRPWLPTLLTAVLPAIWMYRRRKASRSIRQFDLRELFVVTTLLAVLLGVAIWLKN